MPPVFGTSVVVLALLANAPPASLQPTTFPATSQPTSLPAATALPPDKLYALASPAVVKLIVKGDHDHEVGTASGFIVAFEKLKGAPDFDGPFWYETRIVTNYHVIRPAVSLDVLFSNGESGFVSKVLAEDESVDVAVLEVLSHSEPTQTLRLHDGASVPVGTKVYAIGSPKGLSNTLSEGLISSYRNRGKHLPWMQITAPISPGSSGGPLFSAEGSVLAVTTASLRDSQNLNFAVPASEISRLLKSRNKPRSVWEGASVLKAAEDAFLVAFFRLRTEYHDSQRPPQERSESFEEWHSERVKEGDQLALLIEGYGLCEKKQYDEAIRMLKLATAAEPGDYAYLAYYELAVAIDGNVGATSNKVSDYEAIIEPLLKAKQLNPEFGPTRRFLGDTYSWLDAPRRTRQNTPEALLEADALVRLMPRCYEGYVMRGSAWAKLGRAEPFERDFAVAFELRPGDLQVYDKQAGGYGSLDNWQGAIEAYKKGIAIDGDNLVAGCVYENLANAYEKLGRYDMAITTLERMLRSGKACSDQDWIQGRIAEYRSLLQVSPQR